MFPCARLLVVGLGVVRHCVARQGKARRCAQKAVHTQGGTHKRRSVATARVLLLKGPQARRYTQNAVHTQGGTHKRRSVATAGVLLFKGPQAKWCTQKAVHTQGSTHKRRTVATPGVLLFKGPQARRYTQIHTPIPMHPPPKGPAWETTEFNLIRPFLVQTLVGPRPPPPSSKTPPFV